MTKAGPGERFDAAAGGDVDATIAAVLGVTLAPGRCPVDALAAAVGGAVLVALEGEPDQLVDELGVGVRGWGPLEGELAQALLVLLDEDEIETAARALLAR